MPRFIFLNESRQHFLIVKDPAADPKINPKHRARYLGLISGL